MAEKHSESDVDSGANIVVDPLQKEEEFQTTTRSRKRCSSENIAPPPKSRLTDILPSPEPGAPEANAQEANAQEANAQETDAQETDAQETDAQETDAQETDAQETDAQETDAQELESENTEPQTCPSPPERRKSWRRATITRRSLPALPNPYQVLCRSISTSLSQNERLEKLMEASMKMIMDRTQSSLQTAAHSSMESFQIKVDQMVKEWDCLAKSIQRESQSNGDAARLGVPSIQNAMETVMEAISRLGKEKESWETLLNKHRDKAEHLERKVQKGQENRIRPDSAALAQSSQYQVIKKKPDYHLVLSRQLPKLQTVALIMDTQYKMVNNLLSIRDQSKLVVKETSGQLAAQSGLLELSSDLVKNLITQPLASAAQYTNQ